MHPPARYGESSSISPERQSAANSEPINRTKKRRGFSLIELITVIACVAILASLMLPAFNSIMHSSKTVQCASNLRQIGVAGLAWSADNDQRIFPVYINTEDNDWTVQLRPYLDSQTTQGTNKIFICPERPAKYGYGYNYFNLSWISPGTANNQWIKYSQVSHPQNTVLLVDNYVTSSPTRWRPFARAPGLNMNDVLPDYRHSKKTANVLWVDGHVTPESAAGTITNNAVWDRD